MFGQPDPDQADLTYDADACVCGTHTHTQQPRQWGALAPALQMGLLRRMVCVSGQNHLHTPLPHSSLALKLSLANGTRADVGRARALDGLA